jgi:hypothetical protein
MYMPKKVFKGAKDLKSDAGKAELAGHCFLLTIFV